MICNLDGFYSANLKELGTFPAHIAMSLFLYARNNLALANENWTFVQFPRYHLHGCISDVTPNLSWFVFTLSVSKQYVLPVGHFQPRVPLSWHRSTGATNDASGCLSLPCGCSRCTRPKICISNWLTSSKKVRSIGNCLLHLCLK